MPNGRSGPSHFRPTYVRHGALRPEALEHEKDTYVTQITIPLEDVLTDPQDPIDLTALPPDEAIQHLTEIYSFLPPESDIAITDDLVTLTIPEQDDYRT